MKFGHIAVLRHLDDLVDFQKGFIHKTLCFVQASQDLLSCLGFHRLYSIECKIITILMKNYTFN